MRKFVSWLDNNLLTILTAFLIVMIPLYPKIPLAELIQGYIVRLRLEDLLVLFTFFVWIVQTLRGKARFPRNKISYAMIAYLVVGLLSSLSALYLTETVPLEKAHILKLVFHWLRRIEYFSLFFITYSALRTKQDLKLFARVALLTLVGVVIYGIGQKYFYWPAFSTMNREFSKGIKLYLQPNTRLFSTFGGHYDLAGYLMIALSFVVPAVWIIQRSWRKWLLLVVAFFSYWALVLTTSRTSFIGFIAGITMIAFLLVRARGFWWVFRRWFVTVLVSVGIMFSFSNLLERFTQIIPDKDTRDTILAIQKIVNQPFVQEPQDKGTVSELPSLLAFLFKNEKPKPLILTDAEQSELESVTSSSDMPPSPVKPTGSASPQPELPSDVTEESEQIRRDIAAQEGRRYDGPQYSENALKYGLSMGIRLDMLWPNAIKGFESNPLLGTGYSTLVKSNVGEFTYAESTDNDYLRMLGETGLLGFLTFGAVLYLVIRRALILTGQADPAASLLGLGMIGATVGMLMTATYIDIFESSKVAYTFWMAAAAVVFLSEPYLSPPTRPKAAKK